ncbi:MAG: hypothetical protein FJX59_19700 [Alphaproteobacteria bacterium]|nr:hypothetical protein [Alphaproteobacteria bacterium]
MSKLFLLQAFYCITGIAFFVKDLFEKVPMGNGMVRAFIWPYAQWPFIRRQSLELIEPVLKMVQ